MKNFFDDIRDFHQKFELDYDGPPRALSADTALFRIIFMAEELGEYVSEDKVYIRCVLKTIQELSADATSNQEIPPLDKQLDALVDLVYVALGTAYLHGFDFTEAWRRVHAANMRKVRATSAEQSARGSTQDVVKPPGWTAPDLSDLASSWNPKAAE